MKYINWEEKNTQRGPGDREASAKCQKRHLEIVILEKCKFNAFFFRAITYFTILLRKVTVD